MDGFTKWAEAYPLRNKEAETIAKVLVEQLFCRFGPPLSILSDQGKEVDGRIMNEVCRLFGVAKLRTTPYKPSTNQVERFHKTMNAILTNTNEIGIVNCPLLWQHIEPVDTKVRTIVQTS